MKKLKSTLLIVSMTVMCLVVYYVALVFVDMGKEAKKEQVSTVGSEENANNSTEPSTEQSTENVEVPDDGSTNDNEISIVVFGENFAHDSVINSGKQSDGTYNYDFLFDNLRVYAEEADIAAIYQSTLIGGNDLGVKGYPNFNTPEEMMTAISNAGFDVVLTASNHTNDLGVNAIKNSISLWRNTPGVMALGMNATIDDVEVIPVIPVKGKKIAMLNYTAGMNKPIENQDDKYMVNYLNKDKVISDIAKAEQIADYVIVFPYWVSEYTYDTTDTQREFAKAMVEAGADLIVGASSHFIGEIEMVKADNGNEALCYYSVGNFCSSFNYSDAMVGGMARITLQIMDDTIVLNEEKTGITPIVTHYTHTQGESDAKIVGVYPIWAYTSEMASSHGIITRAGVPFSMEVIDKIRSEKIAEKYLLGQENQ